MPCMWSSWEHLAGWLAGVQNRMLALCGPPGLLLFFRRDTLVSKGSMSSRISQIWARGWGETQETTACFQAFACPPADGVLLCRHSSVTRLAWWLLLHFDPAPCGFSLCDHFNYHWGGGGRLVIKGTFILLNPFKFQKQDF